MSRIEEGVRRFQKEVFPSLSDRFQRLSGSQEPETLFIACSDSRVDPSLLTQTDPGEIFVLRNAGNFVPHSGVDGSVDSAVEYAVAVLGVKQVVVCGHSGCGAVGGALASEGLDSVPAVKDWVRHAAPAVEATRHLEGDERVRRAIEENVRFQLDNLRTHPSVARALAAGELALLGWVYDIGSGEIHSVTTAEKVA